MKRIVGAIAIPGILGLLVSSGVVEAKKTLKWWVENEHQWLALAERFEKANPGVDVVVVTGNMDKFYTMIAGGLTPDIWGPWNTPGIKADVNRNWVLDLTPYIKRDGKAMGIDDFFPGLMREFKVAGRQYSLPVFNYQDSFFYNPQLLKQAGLAPPTLDANDKGWNWDVMVANAQKLTKRSASGAITQQGVEFNTWPSEHNWYHMWGAELYSDEALKSSVPQKIHYDTPEAVKALTKTWELINKYKVAKIDAWQFQTGKCAQSIHCGSLIMNYMKAKGLSWAIAPLPWAVTNKGTMWPDGWRIAKVTKDPELAWKFVKFLCNKESMEFAITDPKGYRLGSAAARKSVYRETLASSIAKATGMTQGDVYRVQEQMDDVNIVKYKETICINDDMVKFVEPVYNALWQNKISPAQAAQNLQKAADKALPTLFARWVRNIRFTGKEPK